MDASIIYIWYCFNMSQLTIGGGLDNLGNTCFFNATLQSILHTRPLATILAQHQHSHSCRLKQQRQWCCFCEMEAVYASTRQAKRYAPNSMINHLKSIFKKFKLGRQEDSHEFLRYLVEGMQEAETGKLIKEPGKQKQAKEVFEGRIKASKVFEVFGGVIKTCVECLNCSHRSITSERYYDFNIECQRSNTLLEGIGNFFAVDKLEGNNKYLCEHCKVRSNARKRFLLDSLPQVATFQLKRFTNSLRKIGKFIQFPLTIDLGRHLEAPHKGIMKLYALVVHAGGSSYSGHYYAFVRVGEDWFKMDDGYVSRCSQESVMSQNAYLLFYEKVFEQSPPKALNGVKDSEIKINHVSKDNQIQPDQRKQHPNIIMNGINGIHGINGINGINGMNGMNGINGINGKNGVTGKEYLNNKIAQKPLVEDASKASINQSKINGIIPQHIDNKGDKDVPKKSSHEKDDWSADEPANGKPKEMEPQSQQQEDEMLKVPGQLKRTRSKEDLEKSLPHGELVLRALEKLLQLSAKMPRTRPHNHSQRHIYNLRRYETVMQKKRKIG